MVVTYTVAMWTVQSGSFMLTVDVALVVPTVMYGLGFVAWRDATGSLTCVGSACDYDTMCWTDPCVYSSCVSYIYSATG
jgi:hypothetical protein